MVSSVDLPDPLGPITATIAPEPTSRLILGVALQLADCPEQFAYLFAEFEALGSDVLPVQAALYTTHLARRAREHADEFSMTIRQPIGKAIQVEEPRIQDLPPF